MNLKEIDHGPLNSNQMTIITLGILAYIFNQDWLVLFVAVMMVLGTVFGRPGFGFLYTIAFKPLGLIKTEILADNPEPHRFAQGFGAVVMMAGWLALKAGVSTLGWSLAWLVAGLAALNLFAGFCVGCALYYWLGRMDLPMFDKSPPPDTIPGMRPKKAE